MSVTGSQEVRPGLSRLPAQLKSWLADRSDNALAQRMAGGAFLIRVASAALIYLSQVLLARWMGTFEFGVYVYVWTWVLLIGALVDFGLASSAQRFIPEYAGLKQFDLLRGFIGGSRWLVVAAATVMAALAALAVWLLAPWLNRYEIIPLFLGCLTLPMFALTHMQEGIARSYNWVSLALVPPYILRSLLLIVLMAAAYVGGSATDAVSAMIAAVIATWLTAIVQLVMLERRLRRTVEAGPKHYRVGTWFATSLPIFMVEGFYMLLTYTDVIVLQQFRSPEEVAVYYAAAKTLALVAFVYFSVAAATAHRFSEYHVMGDRERLAAFLADTIKWTFWPSVAATAILLALGKPFLWLFGPQFVAGYKLMFIFAIGLLARAAVGPVERLLNMVGEQRACATVYAVAFTVNIAACFALIPYLGMEGAAIATTLALLVESSLLFWVTKQRLGLHVFIWGGRRG